MSRLKFSNIGVLTFLFLAGCYTGPNAKYVMHQTCVSISEFERYFDCVERNFHRKVVSSGYGSNMNIQNYMAVGRSLLASVRSGNISDQEAKAQWELNRLRWEHQENQNAAALGRAIGNAIANPY